jgi:hypothetical protein
LVLTLGSPASELSDQIIKVNSHLHRKLAKWVEKFQGSRKRNKFFVLGKMPALLARVSVVRAKDIGEPDALASKTGKIP